MSLQPQTSRRAEHGGSLQTLLLFLFLCLCLCGGVMRLPAEARVTSSSNSNSRCFFNWDYGLSPPHTALGSRVFTVTYLRVTVYQPSFRKPLTQPLGCWHHRCGAQPVRLQTSFYFTERERENVCVHVKVREREGKREKREGWREGTCVPWHTQGGERTILQKQV